MRWSTSMFFVVLSSGIWSAGAAQPRDVVQVFQELKEAETSNQAAGQLRELARTDVSARKYLSDHLPDLIVKTSRGEVWINAVRLAGDLKIVEAAPALASSLQNSNVGGPVTFAEEQRLDNDPAGKALVKMGDPATRPVAQVLEHGDRNARWRAVLVLLNINSTNSIQILRSHIPKESNTDLRRLIINRIGG